jgi:hypothetical protein
MVLLAGKKIKVDGANMRFKNTTKTMCFGGLQQKAAGLRWAVFGDTFMKHLYIAFRHPHNGPPKLGFAQQPR